MNQSTKLIEAIDQDLQLEADFRLSAKQRAILQLTHQVTISYVAFRPFAKRVQHYLAITSEDDRVWSCIQDLATLDYTIYILNN